MAARVSKESQLLTSFVGLPATALDTPALLVDLDILEANIAQMAQDIADRGSTWRPHTKANKSPAIAWRELRAGAIGITCAKLGEAETLVASGITDILIANQIVGPIKTRRLAQINKQPGVDVKVNVDSIGNVREIGAAAVAAGSTVRVLIEIDSGMERAGVQPSQVLAFARQVLEVEGVELAGVMTWEGHTMDIPDADERERTIQSSVKLVIDAVAELRANGIPVEIVSCGGTGTYLTTSGIAGVTEIEAGGGIWGDAVYLDLGANVRPSLRLVAQVTSRPTPTRVIVDCGRKTVDPGERPPLPVGIELAGPVALSAEHGTLTLAEPSDSPRVGDRVEFAIGYSDQVVHLHEALFGVRDGIIEEVIPVLARGRLQ